MCEYQNYLIIYFNLEQEIYNLNKSISLINWRQNKLADLVKYCNKDVMIVLLQTMQSTPHFDRTTNQYEGGGGGAGGSRFRLGIGWGHLVSYLRNFSVSHVEQCNLCYY